MNQIPPFSPASSLPAEKSGHTSALPKDTVKRRAFIKGAGVLAALALLGRRTVAQAPRTAMTVYKDPNCGCCSDWIKHVEKAGFTVTVKNTTDMSTVKAAYGVPNALGSCHTAQVASYVIEGHVPADLIQRLLRDKPAGRGLAVPGMPVGSPGMEMGSQKDAYQVLLFDKAGKTSVYASR